MGARRGVGSEEGKFDPPTGRGTGATSRDLASATSKSRPRRLEMLRTGLLACLVGQTLAFGIVPTSPTPRQLGAAAVDVADSVFMAPAEELSLQGRRGVVFGAAAALALTLATQEGAFASGGATAGKYTTIPIAKRRYFARVKQGVYEFLLLGSAIKKGELQSDDITDFFSDNLKVQEKRKKRQCLSLDDKTCEVSEKFSSRWEDMKLSMFLLGNAFRMDSGKPPEKVKQVKEAKAFTAQVEKIKKATVAGDRKTAALSYAAALEALEIYLNDVELPPTFAPDYTQKADMNVPSLCQGSFCI